MQTCTENVTNSTIEYPIPDIDVVGNGVGGSMVILVHVSDAARLLLTS